MNKQDMNDYIYKPVAVGAVASLGFSTVVSSKYKVMGMSAPLGLGAIAAGSSLVSSVLADTVYESLPASESDLVYASTAPVITGLSCMAGGSFLIGNADSYGMAQLFVGGLLSEIVGVYIDEMIIMPAAGIN
jgi:hypothetical protein